MSRFDDVLHSRRLVVFLGILLFRGAAIRPDLAPDPLDAGLSLSPYKSRTQVAMVEETVDLTLEPEKLSVRVRFIMENTGPAEDLQVGFPTVYEGELKDFVATVDGKAIETEEVPRVILSRSGESRSFELPWIVWDMRFDAGKKVIVDVSYWVAPCRRLLRIGGCDASSWFKGDAGTRYAPWTAGYILETGAAWKGTIRKAVVNLHLAGGMTPEHLRGSRPRGAKSVATGLRWTFEDFEPAGDIEVTYSRLTIQEEIGEFKRIASEKKALWPKVRLAELYDLAREPQKALEMYAQIIPDPDAQGTILLDDDLAFSRLSLCGRAMAASVGLTHQPAAKAVRQKVKGYLSAVLGGKVFYRSAGITQPLKVDTSTEKKVRVLLEVLNDPPR